MNIQVWGNDKQGYTGYIPEADTYVEAGSFDAAYFGVVKKFLEGEEALSKTRSSRTPKPDLSGQVMWACICGRENPPGRPQCSNCQSPMF